MRDGDLLDDVVARLWTVRERLGSRIYRAAVKGALNGIAAAILEEAERRAGVSANGDRKDSRVIPFPVAGRRKKTSRVDIDR
ncbi:hypothetical protein MSC49_03360 [Methylosinus sp. C49]|uniref:hypothetical protein n=1 Tax=Methylosinus sp. C49 TaxID=2699395 RepID=UPI001366F9AA|nr:hypothetical protein [Methylosinus sp. C49]BBU60401.1 hypothetical protein MSC49_03360 [Methylosinus sp. C49]